MDNKTIEERALEYANQHSRIVIDQNGDSQHDFNAIKAAWIAGRSSAPAALPMTDEGVNIIKRIAGIVNTFEVGEIMTDAERYLATLAKPGGEEGELEQLRRWKKEQTYLMDQLNLPEIGKQIGVGLGQTISDKVLPWIVAHKPAPVGEIPEHPHTVALREIADMYDPYGSPIDKLMAEKAEQALSATPSPVPSDVEGDWPDQARKAGYVYIITYQKWVKDGMEFTNKELMDKFRGKINSTHSAVSTKTKSKADVDVDEFIKKVLSYITGVEGQELIFNEDIADFIRSHFPTAAPEGDGLTTYHPDAISRALQLHGLTEDQVEAIFHDIKAFEG